MTTLHDRYVLGGIIGTGGMSDVYEAEDRLIGRTVAVKMLRLELARDTNFRERFRREAKNSGILNHPAIVSVFDTGEIVVDGVDVPFIVMERVFGRTLRDVLREEGPMSPDVAASTLRPVCDALQASHDAGIIHRDIKPANIMITNTGAVKVMDFGIARALNDTTSAMTQTAAVIGTAQYLSPEQARGKNADARSDVYSLGCVFYELITGVPPFQGETPFAVAYQHVQEDAAPPSSLISDLSPTAAVNVDAVVLTAIAKHPADRYQSATAMGHDLELLSRNAVTQAARSHVATPEAPTVAENPSDQYPATRTVAAAAPAAAPAAAHRQEQKKSRPAWLLWVAAVLGIIALIAGGAFAYDYFTNESTEEPSATTIVVPDLAGKDRDEAARELEGLGFTADVSEEPSPDVEQNKVIRSNPVPGSNLQPGTTVGLVVSSGREITDVPDVTGLSVERASNLLSEFGLVVAPDVLDAPSDSIPEGRVSSQNPSANSKISKGSAVTLTVSSGPELVRVPNVAGMSLQEAESTLSSLGFKVTHHMVDSREPDQQVISGERAGEQASPGTSIDLTVSNGMIISMPDVNGMSRSDAIRALRDAGWTGNDSAIRNGDPVNTNALIDEGRIAGSEPGAGAEIRKDAPVTLRAYRFDPLGLR